MASSGSPSGELFGESRLLAAAEAAYAGDAASIGATVQSLRKSLAAFSGDAGLRDDITLVGFGVD